jgi:hypothetical protein
MRNVAITLDDETASWVRVYAAGQRLSVSRFVGEVLKEVTHAAPPEPPLEQRRGARQILRPPFLRPLR